MQYISRSWTTKFKVSTENPNMAPNKALRKCSDHLGLQVHQLETKLWDTILPTKTNWILVFQRKAINPTFSWANNQNLNLKIVQDLPQYSKWAEFQIKSVLLRCWKEVTHPRICWEVGLNRLEINNSSFQVGHCVKAWRKAHQEERCTTTWPT